MYNESVLLVETHCMKLDSNEFSKICFFKNLHSSMVNIDC